jgi:hypothetical protein
MIPLGILCQNLTPPSPYLIDAQFNVFPFVDRSGHFTVNNTNVTQSSGTYAVFNGTSPQYLEFTGAETFNLQQGIDIEMLLNNSLVSVASHDVFELKGATSYLVAQIYNYGTYAVLLTGATGGNTDNYTIVGGLTIPILQNKTLRIVYDAVAGTLKTYVDGVLDINQSGITPRINESRVMYLSTVTYTSYQLSADVDYFIVKNAN